MPGGALWVEPTQSSQFAPVALAQHTFAPRVSAAQMLPVRDLKDEEVPAGRDEHSDQRQARNQDDRRAHGLAPGDARSLSATLRQVSA